MDDGDAVFVGLVGVNDTIEVFAARSGVALRAWDARMMATALVVLPIEAAEQLHRLIGDALERSRELPQRPRPAGPPEPVGVAGPELTARVNDLATRVCGNFDEDGAQGRQEPLGDGAAPATPSAAPGAPGA